MTEPANDELPEALVDRAYEAMCEELNNWSIVGPLEEPRAKPLPPREFWNAVRNPNQIIGGTPTDLHHLATRQHAVACVQWHGLRAALVAVMGELGPLPSDTGDNSNG